MSQEWYLKRDGKQFGPFLQNDLKRLANQGLLRRNDMISRAGIHEWRAVETIPGLLNTAPASVSSTPPPLPRRRSEVATMFTPGSTLEPNASVPPIPRVYLWNPVAVRAWSIILTPAFGSFLLARNWKSLGDDAKATQAMLWFYGYLAFIALAIVTPDGAIMIAIFNTVGLAFLIAWALTEARKQVRYVKETYGTNYQRRPWIMPIGIFVACMSLPLAAMFLTAAISSPTISAVKYGRLEDYPEVTVGELIENFVERPLWSAGLTEDGEEYVNINGRILVSDKPVRAEIQFLVDGVDFELYALEIDGDPQNDAVTASLFRTMYEDWQSARAEKNDTEITTSKLHAFKKVVSKMKAFPDRYASSAEREKFNDELKVLIADFDRIPFEPLEQREVAMEIVEIFERELEDRYNGYYYNLIEESVAQIFSELIR